MPSTEIHGRIGRIFSTILFARKRTAKPPRTGARTISRMFFVIAAPSTGIREPTSHAVSIGVMSGASSVEIEVMVTDSATSAFAR